MEPGEWWEMSRQAGFGIHRAVPAVTGRLDFIVVAPGALGRVVKYSCLISGEGLYWVFTEGLGLSLVLHAF